MAIYARLSAEGFVDSLARNSIYEFSIEEELVIPEIDEHLADLRNRGKNGEEISQEIRLTFRQALLTARGLKANKKVQISSISHFYVGTDLRINYFTSGLACLLNPDATREAHYA